MKDIWQNILNELGTSLPEGKVKVFLEPLKCSVSAPAKNASHASQGSLVEPTERCTITLAAGNDFIAKCVREQFSHAIIACGKKILGVEPRLEVGVDQAPAEKKSVRGRSGSRRDITEIPSVAPSLLMADRQLDLPIALPRFRRASHQNWKYSFEDFVVGPCNQLAYGAATNILAADTPVDMVLLCSSAGLGKTHLTQAVGRALSMEADKQQVRMEYLTAEEFTSQFVQAMKYKAIDEFKERFRNLDMLLLEDVHFLSGKDKTQEELLNTIKNLQAHGGRVVLTSTFTPREMVGLDSQLVSQFCSGYVASITRPDRDMRLHILKEKARRQCLVLPEPVAGLLADRVSGDVRILESCINNLMLQARFSGSSITEKMAFDIIRNVAGSSPELSLEDVVSLVCRSFELTPAQLSSRSRRQHIVVARNTAFFLLRKHTSLSLEQIGERFNRRHSTVSKGITSVEREMGIHSALGNQIESAVNRIEHSVLTV